MNINKLNFSTHFDLLSSSVKQCDFLSFDCEFTGIPTTFPYIFFYEIKEFV